MTSFVEQRLKEAVSTLNHRVNTSVAAALEQRLGPAGGALTAQITFTAAPVSISPSVPPTKAQVLSEVSVTNGNNGAYLEEPASAPSTGKSGRKEKEQPTEKQKATEPEAPMTESPDSGDELSACTTAPKNSNEPTSEETGAIHSGASKSGVYPLFADITSKSKTTAGAALPAKPNAMKQRPSSSVDVSTPKRKANQKEGANKVDDTGGSDRALSEEESEIEKAKRKRTKIKLDPPGYNNGPSIRFRRVSPQLTACAKAVGSLE